MLNFTPEEKKVTLFLLGLAVCGLVLNYLVKANCRVERLVYPALQIAKLNLNKVSLAELTATNCVASELARRILEYRNLYQGFSCLEQLKEVKGIGDQRYEKLKELFFIE